MTTKIIPEIKGFDADVQEEYNSIKARQRDLNARLRAVNTQIAEVRNDRAALVAEGSKYFAENEQLAELRAEAEALVDGCDFLASKAENLKRFNTWLHG